MKSTTFEDGELFTVDLGLRERCVRTLKHMIQRQEQQNNRSLQTLYMLELDLNPSPTGGVNILSNDQ